jgi:alpha-L-rhamnosidase
MFMSVIWSTNRDREMFLRARRSFDLDGIKGVYQVRLTCSGRYRLWINGEPVSRGPAHSGTHVKRVDVLDVTQHLVHGRNQIAVQLIHFDYATAQGVCEKPGFEFSLSGQGVQVISDSSWKLSDDTAYQLPSFRRNNFYGPQEIYDAREEEPWISAEYDDSAWPQAVEVDRPWGPEIARGIPFAAEGNIKPVSVVRIAEVLDQEHFPAMWNHQSYQSLAVTLLQDIPEEPALTQVAGAESLFEGTGAMTVMQPVMNDPDQIDRRCATVIFDFGKEITGYTHFEVSGNAGAMIDIVHGELITAGRVQAMRQGTHYADRYILREGRQRHEIYDWKGFRYIQLTFRNLTEPLTVHDLGVAFSSYPVIYRGGVLCDDELLEQIWQTGAYTQQLCMHDRLMDCPWREQAQWLGDGRIQLLILQNAFGDAGQDIIDFALWWIVAVKDVALFEGDKRFVREMLPHMEKLLSFFAGHLNDDGLIDNIPGWVFIDWANLDRKGCVSALNGIYYMALKCAEDLNRWVGEDRCADKCLNARLRIEKHFHRIFWSEESRLYRDASASDRSFSQHTQVIAVLSGLARTDAGELMRRTCVDKDLVKTSPFFSFYLLEALGQVGMGAEAVEVIRDRWGAMLKAGATTFWEEWQTNGTYRDGCWAARPRSLCHAWSAAPTAWMSRYLLGIRQDELDGPLLFAPCPGGCSEASGSVPTRYGTVRISWVVADGEFSAKLTLPPGCPEPSVTVPDGFQTKTVAMVHQAAASEKKRRREPLAVAG